MHTVLVKSECSEVILSAKMFDASRRSRAVFVQSRGSRRRLARQFDLIGVTESQGSVMIFACVSSRCVSPNVHETQGGLPKSSHSLAQKASQLHRVSRETWLNPRVGAFTRRSSVGSEVPSVHEPPQQRLAHQRLNDVRSLHGAARGGGRFVVTASGAPPVVVR